MNINELIVLAYKEDIGTGDLTTQYLDLPKKESLAHLIAKEQGVICGLDVAKQAFLYIDSSTRWVAYKKDGDFVEKGDIIAKVEGYSCSLLQAERVALNFLQRMSGIATLTRKHVDLIKPYNAKLLDTRKTTPLLRSLEKYAVRTGGAFNHRFGLYDMIMIKDNHILAAGSITEAVSRIKSKNTSYKIEVEVKNLTELQEAVNNNVDRVMLDNMLLDQVSEAVNLYKGKVEMEVSGNVKLDTIEAIAATGVDYISSGSLTHSYQSMDISLLFKE
ncbi:MAG TPA: carboxylating nicotinate-nucleotide diphosphorylase [Candidatus Cloacimonadota bacterium]|nr:carboxylating nicotinate-nucleotide diphosphorylase [Candidatus Cloacimonadota bacterium]